ncbi:MAG: DUF4271 domain-containing protein [Porphyromonadaceae bacterium]|nr:DUF4271 domain-containing protein [Porphyromonadaceae bacterium]
MWTTEIIEAIIHLCVAISWGLSLLLLLLTPGLMGLVVNSYTHSRTEYVSAYISRFVPHPIFIACSYLVNTLCIAIIGLSLGLRLNYWNDSMLYELGSYTLWLILGTLTLGLFYLLDYRLWSYLYINGEASVLLRQDYFIISIIRGGALLLLSLLSLTPIPTNLYFWILGICLGIIQLLRCLQGLRRLKQGRQGLFCVFLYLCAHELLPWLYIVQLVDSWI